EVARLALAGKAKEAAELSMGQGRALRVACEGAIDGILDANQKILDEEGALADEQFKSSRTTLSLASAISIICGVLIAFLTLRSISRAIDRIITQLMASSGEVGTAAQQVASASSELSQSTTEQAASLEETSSSIEEMNSMVAKSAENAK